MLGGAVTALLLAACSSTAGEAPSPAASTSPKSTALAVMVHRAGVGEPYIVQLVHPSGVGGPSVSALSRSDKTFFRSTPCPQNTMCESSETAAYTLPETSISSTHVYFLDGETQVRAMAPDGGVTSIKNIEAPANSQVVFAVSPDDTRMAVSIITLATAMRPAGPFTERMYVEDLTTTAHRVELYSSTTTGKWPVGWHAGELVVGVGSVNLFNLDNPYGADSYELLDAATGRTASTLGCSAGLLVHAGTACVDGGCISTTTCTTATAYRQGWDGARTRLDLPDGPGQHIFTAFRYTELSPGGTRLAAEVVTDPQAGSSETAVIQDGALIFTTLVGAPQGWLDDDHLIVSTETGVNVINLRTGDEVPMTNLKTIPQQGMPSYMGVLPEDLG